MKLLAFGLLTLSAIAAPQLSSQEVSAPPVANVALTVSSSIGQMENYQARMTQAIDELDGILDDVEQMNPESLMRLEPVLAELVTRQDELVDVINLGDSGLKDGLIHTEEELRQIQEILDPEISAFEDAVFRLRAALDRHLNRTAEI